MQQVHEVVGGRITAIHQALVEEFQFMGEVAPRDSGCLKTWAENRRRFLGLEPVAAPRPNGER